MTSFLGVGWVEGLGSMSWGRVQGLGLRVSGLGFRV